MKTSDSIQNYLREVPNYLSFFVFPAFLISLSPILIEMGEAFSIDPKDLNLIFAAFTVGGVAGRLTSFFYRAKFTNLHIMIASYSLLALLVTVLLLVKMLVLFFVIYFLTGYLLGIILVIASENLLESPIKNKGRLLTLATGFFPVGSFVAPLIASSLVSKGYGWEYLFYFLLAMAVLMIILYSIVGRRGTSNPVSNEPKLIFKGIFTNKPNAALTA